VIKTSWIKRMRTGVQGQLLEGYVETTVCYGSICM